MFSRFIDFIHAAKDRTLSRQQRHIPKSVTFVTFISGNHCKLLRLGYSVSISNSSLIIDGKIYEIVGSVKVCSFTPIEEFFR